MPICAPIKKSLEYTRLYNARSILEIGSGKGGILTQFDAPVKIGIDNFEPFLREAKTNFPGSIYIKHDVTKLYELFMGSSFDAVIGFDILEHLPRVDMEKTIQTCEELARKLVIFFSPLDERGIEVQPEPVEGNVGMRHITIIREYEFVLRGYSTFTYPDYYGNGANALLAVKEL